MDTYDFLGGLILTQQHRNSSPHHLPTPHLNIPPYLHLLPPNDYTFWTPTASVNP